MAYQKKDGNRDDLKLLLELKQRLLVLPDTRIDLHGLPPRRPLRRSINRKRNFNTPALATSLGNLKSFSIVYSLSSSSVSKKSNGAPVRT